MTEDLFLSILAMDAYNRTDSTNTARGLVVLGNAIGDASVGTAGANSATSFFAQSYVILGANGQPDKTIISYRGTDAQGDVLNGWPLGTGDYLAPQALDAAQFYQQVVGNGEPVTLSNLYAANVVFTGHSMGGGLAGLMASLYGKNALLIDAMTYQSGATAAYNAAIAWPSGIAATTYLLNETPNAPNASGIQAAQVAGQALDGMQPLGTGTSYSTGFLGILDAFQRHSASPEVVLTYGNTTSGVGQDWLDASQ